MKKTTVCQSFYRNSQHSVKAKLPENRIFAGKVGAFVIYHLWRKFFLVFLRELRSILAMTTVFMVIDRQINGKSTFYIQKEEYLNSFIARPANC